LKTIALDFETFFSKKLKYSVRSMIAESYCKHPLFDPYMVSVSDGTQSWAGHPRDFNWESLRGATLLSHNRYFDNSVLNEMSRRGMAPANIGYADWQCTANLTSYICNRRALDQACEYLLKDTVDKAPRDTATNKHWPADFSEAEQKIMIEYARQDAVRCHRLWTQFSDRWPTHERRLSNLTIDQGMRGVQINTELLDTYLMQSHDMLSKTAALLPWLRDVEDVEDDEYEGVPNKPTSTKAIADQCRRCGIACPPAKSKDEEAYEEWESLHAHKYPWIQALSAWRSINKLYKTFLKVKDRLRLDGTLPFGLKYFGAHTGRWSGDAGINFQNFRKIPVMCNNEQGVMEQSKKRIADAMNLHGKTGQWPEWVKYVIDFRALIIPRPGKRMIASDLSQIEPRVLAWLSGDTAFLEQVRGGMSPYEAHARNTMAWTGGKLKDESPRYYALAKARVLALAYGAGWEKFIEMAFTQAQLDITADDPEFDEDVSPFTGEVKQISGYGKFSRQTVKDFRESNPKLTDKDTGLWARLETGLRRSVGEDYVVTLPSGRQMRYESVRAEYRIEKDRKTGKPRRNCVYTAVIGGKRKKLYGGLLTENVTQACARDVFAEHMLRLDARGWCNLFGVHDEAVLEVDESVTAADVEHEMSVCPDWIAGCPVAAEAKVIPCYLK
jgi:hypothetical protein